MAEAECYMGTARCSIISVGKERATHAGVDRTNTQGLPILMLHRHNIFIRLSRGYS
jgi:hypothetical protein